jgi:hypothetical protein
MAGVVAKVSNIKHPTSDIKEWLLIFTFYFYQESMNPTESGRADEVQERAVQLPCILCFSL